MQFVQYVFNEKPIEEKAYGSLLEVIFGFNIVFIENF